MLLALFFAQSLVDAGEVSAQELRGLVLTPDGAAPASGVVLVMMHATRTDSIVARTVTSERGRYSLRAPAMTPTRVMLLRIGYQPMDLGRFELRAGEVHELNVTLSNARLQLATLDVKGTTRCEVKPDGARLVTQLFGEARTALISTTATVAGTFTKSDYVTFERFQDRRGRILTPVARRFKSGQTLKAFASVPIDTLNLRGYAVSEGTDINFYAPDAEVLLSEKFLAQHCLMLVEGKDAQASMIGIGFRPVTKRDNIVDVKGTLWLDRASSELQFLEYEYEGLPSVTRDQGLGGRVDYAQLPGGVWFVSRWSIRMPILEERAEFPTRPLGTGSQGSRTVVVGQQITGGEVQTISVDNQALFVNPSAARAGDMPQDSRSIADIASNLDSLAIALSDRSDIAGLDHAGIASVCGVPQDADYGGMVTGAVHVPLAGGVSDVTVEAQWQDNFRVSAGIANSISWVNKKAVATTNRFGSYRLCELPFLRSVTVSAMNGRRKVRSGVVRLSEEYPGAKLDLSVNIGDIRRP